MVVGTTGWYQHLNDMRSLAARKGAGFLYGTNFSIGVQAFYRLARELAVAVPTYQFEITETHHASKKDVPSGTALSIRQAVQTANPSLNVEILSKREGDVAGVHILEARSDDELIELKHEAFSRRAFAEGAVRAAEWIAGKTGVWDFSEIANQL
jgi:4-hydroxy-tetrahydrodipicolinate reductase